MGPIFGGGAAGEADAEPGLEVGGCGLEKSPEPGEAVVRSLSHAVVLNDVVPVPRHTRQGGGRIGGEVDSGRGLARCLRFWGVADPAPCRDDAGASFQTGPVDPAPALHTGHGDFLHPALPAEVAEEGYGAPPLGLAARATW